MKTKEVIVETTARKVLKGSSTLSKTVSEAVGSKETKGKTKSGVNFRKIKDILILF